MDLWIFIMDLSMACLRLVTLIAQIDVDLWIFHNHSIIYQNSNLPDTKRSGYVDLYDL